MKLCYAPRAVADLEAIAVYLYQRNPQGAVRVRAAILETLQRVVQFLLMGRRQTTDTVRKIAVRKYNYLIYYSFDEAADEIVVLTIQHGAREREFVDN
jgi:plasmid stabilization system protein ParE